MNLMHLMGQQAVIADEKRWSKWAIVLDEPAKMPR
jgi:hypothetical protein